MKLALDTYKDIIFGDNSRRIHALFTLALWTCAGAFLFSTILYYITPYDNQVAPFIGGLAISAVVGLIKFS
ncbi:hypothetical protein [Maritalea sp. S77]|uniref:hypothetical protein n=1 Tax=Maritalea sp. S77 TaxID=3415125 RepID=UPI003C7DD5C4